MSLHPLSIYFKAETNIGEFEKRDDPEPSLYDPEPNSTFGGYSFTIGQAKLDDPLVDIPTVEGHLTLLCALSELGRNLGIKMPIFREFRGWYDNDKWRYFVGVAVERFDVWCENLDENDMLLAWDVFLPPLDVLMVWRAYLLNPLWYAEDAQRIPRCKILAQLGLHFKYALKSDRLPELLKDEEASEERKALWTARTGFDFDPKTCIANYRSKPIKNLCCGHVDVLDFCNKFGKGYLQKSFEHQCTYSFQHKREMDSVIGNRFDYEIRRPLLAVQKFAKDLIKEGSENAESYLAGSYLSSIDPERVRTHGLRLKTAVLDYIKADKKVIRKFDDPDKFIWETSRYYTMSDFKAAMGDCPLATRIVSAYTDEKVYSVGLVEAVLRQSNFVDKMEELKWTVPEKLNNSESQILEHAIARYHAFLDLMTAHPVTMLVPTLDIDLVWHTHQLLFSQYGGDCIKHIGMFIDHDDKVEGSQLSNSFDQTGTLWKARFKVPYTFCGCPTQPVKLTQRVSSIIQRRTSSQSKRASDEAKVVAEMITPPLTRREATLATHPSDHNAIRRTTLKMDYSGAAYMIPGYREIHQRREKEVWTNRKTLYASDMYHPRTGAANHPCQTTFLYPVPVWLDSGVESTQCAAGYTDPYVVLPPKEGHSGGGDTRTGDAGGVSSCGAVYSCGGGAPCGAGGCGAYD